MSPVRKQPQNVTPNGGGWLNAALAVAAGQPASVAAAAAGVTVRTVRRWLKRPAFKAAVEEIRSQLVSETLGKLLAQNGAAVDTLAALMKSEQDQVKLAAASRLLELTLKTRHQVDLQREIEFIKDQFAQMLSEHPGFFEKGKAIHDNSSSND